MTDEKNTKMKRTLPLPCLVALASPNTTKFVVQKVTIFRQNPRLNTADPSSVIALISCAHQFPTARWHTFLWFCGWGCFFRSSQGAEHEAQGSFFAKLSVRMDSLAQNSR